MQWLRQIIVDLLAIVVIALAVFYDADILTYVVYIYTCLMVVARTFALFSENFRSITKKNVSEAPLWVYHVIYLLSVLILAIGQWYVTAAGWIYIWAVAAYIHKQKL